MSHVATIELDVDDLPCLAKAAKRIGCELVEQKTYKWWGASVGDYPLPEGFTKEDLGKCDHAIRVVGNAEAYEVGVVKRGNSYKLLWDFYCGGYGLEEAIGKDCGKLKQAYALEKSCAFARRQGWHTQEKVLPNGAIQLVMS